MDVAGTAAERQWDAEVSAIVDRLNEGKENPVQAKGLRRYVRILKAIDKQTVRQLPEFLDTHADGSAGTNWVIVNVLEHGGDLETKLKKIYLHTRFLMGRYGFSANASVFLISDVLVDKKPEDEPDLTVEQERLLLEINTDLLHSVDRELNTSLRKVVLANADRKTAIMELLTTREISTGTELSDLLSSADSVPLTAGVL